MRHVQFLPPGTLARIRLIAFGFLPGKEVKDAKIGNLGLQDRESKLVYFRCSANPVELKRAPRFEMGTTIYLSLRW